MPWAEIALPGALLLAKFALKLFVDRSATLPDVIAAVLSLPVDVVFVAASLLAGYTISGSPTPKLTLALFIACLAAAIFNVLFWRRSDDLFTKDRYFAAFGVAFVNYALSIGALVVALDVLVEGATK